MEGLAYSQGLAETTALLQRGGRAGGREKSIPLLYPAGRCFTSSEPLVADQPWCILSVSDLLGFGLRLQAEDALSSILPIPYPLSDSFQSFFPDLLT